MVFLETEMRPSELARRGAWRKLPEILPGLPAREGHFHPRTSHTSDNEGGLVRRLALS